MARSIEARVALLSRTVLDSHTTLRQMIRRAQWEIEQLYPDCPANRATRQRIADTLMALDETGQPWPMDAPPLPPMVAELVRQNHRQATVRPTALPGSGR